MSAFLPSVSVVVAARNAEQTIAECLDSLVALRYPRDRLELVVVDNGSRDRTRTIVEAYSGSVTLLDESKRGPAPPRNTGIRAGQGDVVALTDADCTVDPGWLEELVAPLADPAIGLAGGTILARRPATPIELLGEEIHDHRRAIEGFRPPYVITMNWAARRAVIDTLGPFDETLLRGSDAEYAFRAGQAGFRLVHCPGAIVYHRNERTLPGLFREGFQHAYHAGELRRRYERYITAEHARRPDPAAPSTRRAGPPAARVAFVAGKRLGRFAARWRARTTPAR